MVTSGSVIGTSAYAKASADKRSSGSVIRTLCTTCTLCTCAPVMHLDHRSRPDHTILGNDDDSVPDEVPVAVAILHVCLVHETRSLTNACVLIDDHTIECDATRDPERGRIASGGGVLIGFVIVGTEQQRPADGGARTNERPDADDGFFDGAAVQ